MNGAGYWVNISQQGRRLGAGFLVTSCYVLTAHHCLANTAPGVEDVELEFESGEVLTGRIHRRAPRADLALIDVPGSGKGPTIPGWHRPSVGEAWWSPYRPNPSDAILSGMIHAVPVSYQCEGGDSIEAMQLRCGDDLGDYQGYSGSPIEGGGPDGENRLFGVLIEQYPEHYPDSSAPRRASTVLWAATLSEVLRRFDCFHMDPCINLLPSSSGIDASVPRESASEPSAGSPVLEDAKTRIAVTVAEVEALDGLEKRGLLPEGHITKLKVKVIERDFGLSGDQGEQP